MARGKRLDIEFGIKNGGWEFKELCESCGKSKEACRCHLETIRSPQEHRLVLRYEKRNGKPMTLVGEFFLDKQAGKALLKLIRKTLGCGGTFKEGWLMIQGEKRMLVKEALEAENYRFKG